MAHETFALPLEDGRVDRATSLAVLPDELIEVRAGIAEQLEGDPALLSRAMAATKRIYTDALIRFRGLRLPCCLRIFTPF
jgi:hypothetical protein